MMNKLSLMISIIILVCSFALLASADIDYSALSDSDLWMIIDSARKELAYRNQYIIDGNTYTSGGITLIISNDVSELDWLGVAKIDCVVINNSKEAATLSIDELYVNGWQVLPEKNICDNLAPGRKALGSIEFYANKANAKAIDDIGDIELSIQIKGSSQNTRSEIKGIRLLFEHVSESEMEAVLKAINAEVFWNDSIMSKTYHTHDDCEGLDRESTLVLGSVEQAIKANHTRLCALCAKRDSEGSLLVRNGAIIGAEDNWLILEGDEGKYSKYYHIADVSVPNGFFLSDESFDIAKDSLRTDFMFDSADGIMLYIAPVNRSVDDMISAVHGSFVSMLAGYGGIISEIKNIGYNGRGFDYHYSYVDDNKVTCYIQSMVLYIPSAQEGRCILVSANNYPNSEDGYRKEEELIAIVQRVAEENITLIEQ